MSAVPQRPEAARPEPEPPGWRRPTSTSSVGLKVGVLALQGEVPATPPPCAPSGPTPVEVRSPTHLDDVDGLVLPGGESTTMSKLLDSSDLRGPLGRAPGRGPCPRSAPAPG